MQPADARIGKLLYDLKVVDGAQAREVQKHVDGGAGRFHHIVAELGFANEQAVAAAIASGYGLQRVSLGQLPADRDALSRLERGFCEQHNLFPCALRDGGRTLWIAMSDPGDTVVQREAAQRSGCELRAVVAGHDEIQEAILRGYYGESFKPRATGGATSLDAPAQHPPTPAPRAAPRLAPEPSVDDAVAAVAAAAVRPPRAGGTPSKLDAAEAALDDLLGSGAAGAPAELTEAEQARLELLIESRTRASRAFRAVVELCAERGVFHLEEFRRRAK